MGGGCRWRPDADGAVGSRVSSPVGGDAPSSWEPEANSRGQDDRDEEHSPPGPQPSIAAVSPAGLLGHRPPPTFAGWLKKRSSGSLGRWSRRHFVLKDGRLHWAKEKLPVAQPAFVPERSCADLARTQCDASLAAGDASVLEVAPSSGGKWHGGDLHGRAGTTKALLLDASGTPGLADQWLEHLRRHMKYARHRASLRLHRYDERMGLRCVSTSSLASQPGQAPPDDVTATDDVCAVCLEELDPDVEGGAEVVQTPCGHCFHRPCMRGWMRRHPRHPTCPTCRLDLSAPACAPGSPRP